MRFSSTTVRYSGTDLALIAPRRQFKGLQSGTKAAVLCLYQPYKCVSYCVSTGRSVVVTACNRTAVPYRRIPMTKASTYAPLRVSFGAKLGTRFATLPL
eukprot:318701-Rhodomonas_salina.1